MRLSPGSLVPLEQLDGDTYSPRDTTGFHFSPVPCSEADSMGVRVDAMPVLRDTQLGPLITQVRLAVGGPLEGKAQSQGRSQACRMLQTPTRLEILCD